MGTFVYGIPELHREELRDADLISSAGCMAATSILGLYPLFQAKVVDLSRPVVVEAKTGSSGSGGAPDSGRITLSEVARCAHSSRPATATRPRSSRS